MPYAFGKEEVVALRKVMKSNLLDRYIKGDNSVTREAEHSFANYIGSKDSLMVSSGTAALICGLVGLGIKKGDEVIVPAYTYIATALAVLAVGAVPVIAEINNTMTLSCSDLRKKVNNKTKAVIPVHMLGFPSDMDEIIEIAKEYNLLILEDVAQACGGSFKGQKLGSIGDAGAFSFNHFKMITCGEGGALVIKGQDRYNIAEVYHHGGIYFEPGFSYDGLPLVAGVNYRMSELSAAIISSQIGKLPDILDKLQKDRKRIRKILEANKKKWFSFVSCNDAEGDCCRTLGLIFEDNQTADKFCQKSCADGSIDAWNMCTPGHICTDWTKLTDSLGIKIDHCEQSMRLLRRTVGISMKVDRTEKEFVHLEKRLKNVINEIDKEFS